VAGQPYRLAAPTAGENEYFASRDGSMIVFFNGIQLPILDMFGSLERDEL
jgi:hypothetical protein